MLQGVLADQRLFSYFSNPCGRIGTHNLTFEVFPNLEVTSHTASERNNMRGKIIHEQDILVRTYIDPVYGHFPLTLLVSDMQCGLYGA